ncbi:hypothetical protein VT84_03280 [Gemmata sp. SH-PL17]|uniref:RNA polymerase sigma factor n=1 Tax=Gemmata sp. SH-PL17 TaxID=1630693 RepID=UPI00078DDF49|nr:sigma-70 family RNA polymerase sigma factor [Gemmata sp. SH-PL17]AMV23405.1 hypothetical protein VT84_03280 [Gemmata sp. SH-PL17]
MDEDTQITLTEELKSLMEGKPLRALQHLLGFISDCMSDNNSIRSLRLHDRAEATQRVFAKLLASFPNKSERTKKQQERSFDSINQFKSFINVVANRVCMDLFSESHRSRDFSSVESEIASKPPPRFPNPHALQLIKSLIDSLPSKEDITMVKMKFGRSAGGEEFGEGLSVGEIAGALQRSPASVSVRLYRAMNFIREKLKKIGYDTQDLWI